MKLNPENDLPEDVARALAILRDAAPPDERRWAAHRAAFLQRAQDLRPTTVTSVSSVRHKEQKSHKTWFQTLFAKEAHPMVVALKLMLMFSLMVGASAGTVSAAQGSIPGDALYNLKLAWEQAQLTIATNPEAKLERLLTMAQTRLQEAQKLAEQNKDVPTALVQRYQLHVREAEHLVVECDPALRQQLMDRLQTRLQEHEHLMTQLQDRVQQRVQSQTALQQMLQTQEQVRERLQQHWEDGTPGQQGPDNSGGQQGPGPNPSATPQNQHKNNDGTGEQHGPGPNPSATPQGPGEGGGQQGPNPTATCTPQVPGDGSGQQGPGGPGPNPTATPHGPDGPNHGGGGSGSGHP